MTTEANAGQRDSGLVGRCHDGRKWLGVQPGPVSLCGSSARVALHSVTARSTYSSQKLCSKNTPSQLAQFHLDGVVAPVVHQRNRASEGSHLFEICAVETDTSH